jgi:hypothetical protein
MASGRRADEQDPAVRRIDFGHAPGADHGDLQPHRRHLRVAGLHGKAIRPAPRTSRSRAAIAAWAIIPPSSMPVADRLAQPEGKWAPFDRSGWRGLIYPDPNR